ncbi:hypothetical protein CEXT_149471 [Caerostris extrusa]|uniref:Uncharacterized protein n=1 Tax=Caerostris extrusa TaxID=172846 RepID=A0AAV4XQ65_CAEEX|nr:hypothetical protein CEXT_149471 [Caerostris extrusa]
MLLNEDDWAERVIPAARKDLSKMFDEPIHPDTSQLPTCQNTRKISSCWKRGELDYEELDDIALDDMQWFNRHQTTLDCCDDSRVQDSAKPIHGKGCIVSPLQKLERKKRATRLVDQHPRYDGRVLKGRHQQPRCDDVCHPTLTKKTDSCPETRHLRTGETCFPL